MYRRRKAMWLVFLCLVLGADKLSAAGLSDAGSRVEVFLTGNEQAVINRFVKETDRPLTGQFSNSLDHAVAVLVAKAYPKPDAMGLARATIVSLCEESERQTGSKIDVAQSDTWVSTVSRTRSFDSVLKSLAALDPRPNGQQRLIEAGLNGMLRASGWDSACVLPQAQAAEIKRMSKARETATEERGILGLKLDRWPVVEVAPGAPAAEAGLRSGDAVVSVNGKDVSGAKTAAGGMKILQGPPGEVVKLAVKRNDRTLDFEVTRASAAAAMVRTQEVEPGVLLVTIPTFEGSGIADTVKRFVHPGATNRPSVVILDLRDNGGGRPEEANGVADIFLDGKQLQICEFRDGTRIAFRSNPGAVSVRTLLLTNKGTGSAAEMLVMALHDNFPAIIVGEGTAGALFGKDVAELVGGQTIFFRTEPTVLSPAGHDYSMAGIPPDVRIPDSKSHEKDEILVRAIELARAEVTKE